MLSSPLFWTNLSGANLQLFIGVSMKTWGVSLTWGQVYWRGLPGKLGVGGNYLWCLVIVIYMRLGRAKRLGDRGGFKVIIWGRARHKGGNQFLGGRGVDPCGHHGSNHYHVFNTILTRKMQHNIFHFVNTTQYLYYGHKQTD